MGLNLSKHLKPAFLASAFLLSSVPATALAHETQATEENQAETADKNTCAQKANKDKKPLYEMSFEELLKEKSGDHAKAWDVYEFYQLRRITLDGSVNKESVDRLITEIEVLDGLDSSAPITLMINSPGGSVYDGLRLYNAIKTSKSQIHTFANGMAASMAAVILIAGDVREATPESRILIHQVSAGTSGKFEDMEHDLNHISTLQDDLYEIISENTGLSIEDIHRIGRSDIFYNGEEAMRLGFIDRLTDVKAGRDIRPGTRQVPESLYPENRVRDYYARRAAPGQ